MSAQTEVLGAEATKTASTTGSDLGIVIHSNDPETVWNAFRLANHAAGQKDKVRVFLLAKGVEAQNLGNKDFDVEAMMKKFVDAGGEILACGTCLKLRNTEGTALCPLSTMADLYEIVKRSDKIITF
ncbi:MAG TPA: DsrE family protein [Flavobacteriales bacterium]|nr:DsrE family protein [Flavobacteriales bacterium]HMR28680.1 DsrE family protein [Flavobacteriales bacterium]